MGTNYYLHTHECLHCGRSNQIHIGKKSAGWSFAFQAYNDGDIDAIEGAISSRNGWVNVLRTTPGTVRDEYGVVVTDPVEWLISLVPPTGSERLEEERNTFILEPPDVVWRDPEGFRFRRGVFF